MLKDALLVLVANELPQGEEVLHGQEALERQKVRHLCRLGAIQIDTAFLNEAGFSSSGHNQATKSGLVCPPLSPLHMGN